jgi:hypothetical protein
VKKIMTQEMETLCPTRGSREKGRGKEKDAGRESGQLHNSQSQDLHHLPHLLKVI